MAVPYKKILLTIDGMTSPFPQGAGMTVTTGPQTTRPSRVA